MKHSAHHINKVDTSKPLRKAIIWFFPMLLGCAFFIFLGMWQIDRAQQKREILTAYAKAPKIALNQLKADTPLYSNVTGMGKWLPQQLLLDNQILNGRQGVHVLTPVLLKTGHLLLVNRGWLPMAADRRSLPSVKQSTELLQLSGRTAPLPQPGLKLGDQDKLDKQWPQLITYVDAQQLQAFYAEVLEQPQLQLLPYILKLTSTHIDGFAAVSSSPVNFGPDRHLAYAYTWFSLALTVLITYMLLSLRKKTVHGQ